MKRERMPPGALVAMAILVAFSGAANVSIVTTGSVTTPINETTDYTISAIYRIGLAAGAPGTLTIDNGSTLAQTDSIMLMGHVSPATVTIESGGWFKSTTNDGEDSGYYITLGNQVNGSADVTVTGSGSKMTCLGKVRVGRRAGGPPSHLTWETNRP